MTWKRYLISLSIGLVVAGCGVSGPPGTPAAQINVTASSLFTWPSLCKRITIHFLDADGNPARWGRDESLPLTVENAVPYLSNRCDDTPINTIYTGPDNQTATFWIRSADLDTVKITVSGSLTGQIELTSEIPVAKLVLGQDDFTSDNANEGVANPTLGSLSDPNGIAVCGDQLFVVDRGNHRVLGWNTAPTANGQDADLVLGQANGTADGAATNQTGMDTPSGIACSGDTLFVADRGNNRILGYTPIPTTTNTAPTFVWGQDDFDTGAAGATAQSRTRPTALSILGSLLVAVSNDTDGWNRALVWNTLPSASSGPTSPVGLPDLVLGQTGFTSASTGTAANRLNAPEGVTAQNGYLMIADAGNNRVVLHELASLATGATPSLTLGRADLGTGFGGTEFDAPADVAYTEDHLVVADNGNARILVWNGMPTSAMDSAAVAIGAPSDFSAKGLGATTAIQGVYAQIVISGDKMWVADNDLNRVLLFPAP